MRTVSKKGKLLIDKSERVSLVDQQEVYTSGSGDDLLKTEQNNDKKSESVNGDCDEKKTDLAPSSKKGSLPSTPSDRPKQNHSDREDQPQSETTLFNGDEESNALLKKIKSLEAEVKNVSSLLAETITSVKGNESQIENSQLPTIRARRGTNAERDDEKGGGGKKGPFSPNRRNARKFNDAVASDNFNSKMEQLERICRVHQFTVLRQRKEISAMKKTMEEDKSNLNALINESKANQEKISALESQFIALNEAKDNSKVHTNSQSDDLDCLTHKRSVSIIQIDSAYVANLEAQSSKTSALIAELKTDLKVEQSRNTELKNQLSTSKVLQDRISALTIKLQARDATISALDESYSRHENSSKQGSNIAVAITKDEEESNVVENHTDELQNKDEGNKIIHLKAQLASKEATISKLENQLSSLQRIKKDPVATIDGGKQRKLSIRRVTLLQEMLDASTRRLSVVLSRLEDKSTDENDVPFLLSICDKFSLMQHYVKVSLHLLENRLSNELESLRLGKVNGDVDEGDDAIQARFDQTLESLRESEQQIQVVLDEMRKDIDHQNIKITAKDGVIEDLIRSDKEKGIDIESLQSELNILKSLNDYSSVSEGVFAQFRESGKMESELHEKERIIQRLNNVIEEYRAQEDFGG